MANYDASTVLAAAYAQATGSTALAAINVEDIIDRGADSSVFTIGREPFTKALIEQCAKMFFTDASYQNNYEDPFYVDSRRFASVVQTISVTAPSVKANPAWASLTSGTSTVGSYTVQLPEISVRAFAKSESYSIDVTVTNEQWDDAVRSADELEKLVDFIFVQINNAVLQHKEDLMALNRATLMAELLLADADATDTGVHKIELRAAYNAAKNKNISTKEAFRADPDAMRWAGKTVSLYADYLMKQSTLFNVGGKVKFVPRDRLVIELNSDFERSLTEVALSDDFIDDIRRRGSYHTVPWWQAEIGASSSLGFEDVTAINVKLDKDTTVSQAGIVALLADKYALMHTIRSERVASQYFDIDALTLYSFQHRDSYMCNSSLPALIFTIEDPST